MEEPNESRINEENSEVLTELLTNGNIVRRNQDEHIMQSLLKKYLIGRMFYPEHLNFIFAHGVHLDPDYEGGTLARAFHGDYNMNAIRWLIRHGAYCTASLYPMLCRSLIEVRMLDSDNFVGCIQRYKLPLLEVLLQVGLKPSENLMVHLGELQMIIQAYLQQEDSWDQHCDISRQTANIYADIIYGEELTHRYDRRKVFPLETEQQMAHLGEFSDHSLDVYPEELNMADEKRKQWEQTLTMISNILSFLKEPHTLQWHCRVCLRESLVSLSPSVIRNLSVPAILKRFILCHEL